MCNGDRETLQWVSHSLRLTSILNSILSVARHPQLHACISYQTTPQLIGSRGSSFHPFACQFLLRSESCPLRHKFSSISCAGTYINFDAGCPRVGSLSTPSVAIIYASLNGKQFVVWFSFCPKQNFVVFPIFERSLSSGFSSRFVASLTSIVPEGATRGRAMYSTVEGLYSTQWASSTIHDVFRKDFIEKAVFLHLESTPWN